MKISELSQISAIRRDIRIPISISGQNMSITLGQIIDATSAKVVPFGSIDTPDLTSLYTPGAPTIQTDTDAIVYVAATKRFYYKQTQLSASTFYAEWNTSHLFIDDNGKTRTDCLFLSSEGRLYQFNGAKLISAGLTDEQAKQLELCTAKEVASEEEMEQRIATGEYEPGQFYYLPEDR